MNIHQIQMKYSAQEDRILLRISSTERAEFRFWLTRRYVKLLWTILLKMLERDPSAAQHADENVRRTLLGFQHESAVQSANFAKPFEEDVSSLPFGANPVLLSRISGKQPDQQQQLLCLHPEQGQGIDLTVNAGLLHMFSKLLVDAVGKSDWDIKLAIDPEFALPQQAQGVPPHKLN